MKRTVWIAIATLLAVNILFLLTQSVLSFWPWRHCAPWYWILPEARYYVQSFLLLLPLVPWIALKFRYGKVVLSALVAALVLHAAIYLVKAHVPGSRRNQYVSACNWAADVIRADYHGPRADSQRTFSWLEYHLPNRPCIASHVARVPYLIGGREASLSVFDAIDTPDYIVDETRKVNRLLWSADNYEPLAERKFGTRDFIIFKRIK